MQISKKIAWLIRSCILSLLFLQVIQAQNFVKPAADSSAASGPINGKTLERRYTNREFNEIFEQNLRISFAGNEFFAPRATILVADLAANFVLINTPKLPFFFVADARVNLRLFAARGDPVQSPSYMPGGTLYFRTNNDYYRPQFLSISYTHHSNGVEGPTFNRNGTINTDSGKFTTNFYTLTYHTGKRIDKPGQVINRYDALGLELDGYLVGLGYIPALRGKYGFVRVNGEWLYNIAHAITDPVDNKKKAFQNWQRIDFQFTYIADKYNNYSTADLKKRLNVYLKYYYQFPFMQNVSFLIGAGYRGQDEYNIFFNNSYTYLTFGFAEGLSFNMHPKE